MLKKSTRFPIILSILLIIIFVLFGVILKTQAAVTLMYFWVELDGNRMKFTWETATESGNVGFFVERSENGVEDYQRIGLLGKDISTDDCESTGGTMTADGCQTDFILAQGNSVSGHLYQNIFDTQIIAGKTYYYRLVAVDQNNREERYTPNPKVTSTNIAVKTSTPTRTPTRTRASRTKVSGGNQGASATNTSNPAQAVRTPTPNTTNIVTSSLDPTLDTTITPTEFDIPTVPLPSITLNFPDTPTPIVVSTLTPVPGTLPDNAGWFTPQRIVVLGIIAFIWIILGGWFFITIRKIQ